MIGVNGKSSKEIAQECGVSQALVRAWAKEHQVAYIGTEKRAEFYIFDEAAEAAFKARNTVAGRSWKEKPAEAAPKGQPRKTGLPEKTPGNL